MPSPVKAAFVPGGHDTGVAFGDRRRDRRPALPLARGGRPPLPHTWRTGSLA
jgi:hypothetical protein